MKTTKRITYKKFLDVFVVRNYTIVYNNKF